ncbi:MAG: hypothetical protein ACREQ4_13935 [Candidatus Binataceae bacterium]
MDLSLEHELNALENQLATVSKAAKSALAELKKVQHSARVGQLRDLNKGLAEARNAAQRFAEEMVSADRSWKFEVEAYFAEGGYLKELLQEAEHAGLNLFERDGRLYCFPMLLTLSGKDVAVMVNRKPERRLRPRELVRTLLARQKRPQRFNEQKLLDTLFDAYCRLGRRILRDWTPEIQGHGPVAPLVKVYDLLTLLPGSEREYPIEEFARDIHLLDRRPELRARDGRRFALPAATGTKAVGQRLTVVDLHGVEKIYVGIRFDKD